MRAPPIFVTLALAVCSYLTAAGPGGDAAQATRSRNDSALSLGARERRATLATGIDARWIELGAREGETLLFLHGYTDTSRSFLPTMRALERLRPELRLVTLDQRGHGGSSLPADPACAAEPERCFRVEDFAADALALLDLLEIERATVVGHSMSSVVAQELALAQRRHGTPWQWKQYGSVPLPAEDAPQTDCGHNVQWAAHERVAADLSAFVPAPD